MNCDYRIGQCDITTEKEDDLMNFRDPPVLMRSGELMLTPILLRPSTHVIDRAIYITADFLVL